MDTSHQSQFSGSTACSCDVRTVKDESVGSVKELMINTQTGQIDYVVLKVNHGFLNLDSKLLALPFESFEFSTADRDIILVKESKESLKITPGFDTENWPSGPQSEFLHDIRSCYDDDSRSLRENISPRRINVQGTQITPNPVDREIHVDPDRPEYRGGSDRRAEIKYDEGSSEARELTTSDLTGEPAFDERVAEEEHFQTISQKEEFQYGTDQLGEEIGEYPKPLTDGPDANELADDDGISEFKDLQNSDDLEDTDDYQSTYEMDEENEWDELESTNNDINEQERDLFDESSRKKI